jgi:predicted alpha/beta superfamily hydrolase
MVRKHTVRSWIYLTLSILGLVTAWVFNGLAVFEQADYLKSWFGSSVDWVLSLDLLIVGGAVITFMLVEARRLKMKRVWLYFLASGLTAMAFTFPLFMFFRERKILKEKLFGGSLERFDFDSHTVDVWVPPTLNSKTPVVLMHDGRNIFHEEDSFTGKTWEVLQALKEEVRGELPLVVAVFGLSDDTRIRELSPQKIVERHPEFWDGVPDEYKTTGTESFGDSYVSLLSDAILPFVLDRYQITHAKERTAVMGASMGGLISLYTMANRPELFGTAICFSTHWPFGGDVMVSELIGMLPSGENHRVWTDTGTKELDKYYPPFHEKAKQLLAAKGYQEPDSLVAAIFPYTGHHEGYWSRRVADALNWWLKAPDRYEPTWVPQT